jgi:MYXO-CTERM domain-containing protein
VAEGEARTPVQIEADIARRRQDLAATLDEIAVRVHPSTIAAAAKAKAAAAVDRTAGRAYVAVNQALTDTRNHFRDSDGAPRMDRMVPVAVAAVALVAVVAGLSLRRRRR